MEKLVTARHFNLHDDLTRKLQDHLAAMEVAHPKLTSARIVMDFQRGRFTTEVLVHGSHMDVEAKAVDADLELSVQTALDRAETQLQKHYQKVKNHHHPGVSALEQEVEGVTDPKV